MTTAIINQKVRTYVGGILTGIFISVVSQFIFVNESRVAESSLSIDNNQQFQDKSSLRWEFSLRPKRRFIFSHSDLIGAFLHFEVISKRVDLKKGLNFSSYDGIKLYAKSSSSKFIITEVNLFVGRNTKQYMLVSSLPVIVGNRWKEYTFRFSEFLLPPWEPGTKRNLVSKTSKAGDINLSNVTAFGLDLKTATKAIDGVVWVDHIRLFNDNGGYEVLSKGDQEKFNIDGSELTWISEWQEY